jgi:hypothetical protein
MGIAWLGGFMDFLLTEFLSFFIFHPALHRSTLQVSSSAFCLNTAQHSAATFQQTNSLARKD